MRKTLKRIIVKLISSIIPIDKLSFKFPVTIKGVLIENNRILTLTTEQNENDIPGGKLEQEDSHIENRLIKEFKSETNLTVETTKFLNVIIREVKGVKVVVIMYEVKNIGTEPIILSHENNSYNWLDISKIEDQKLNWLTESISLI